MTIAYRRGWHLTAMFRVGLRKEVLSWAVRDLPVLWKLAEWGAPRSSMCVLPKPPFCLHPFFSPSCPIPPSSTALDPESLRCILVIFTNFSTPLRSHLWAVPGLRNLRQHFSGVWVLALLKKPTPGQGQRLTEEEMGVSKHTTHRSYTKFCTFARLSSHSWPSHAPLAPLIIPVCDCLTFPWN